MADIGRLTRKQIKTIGALLACQTIAESASMAGVGERTIYRWMQADTFRDALREAANETVTQAVRRLVAGRDDALDTLHKLMLGARSENVRRLAAKDWLDVLHRITELEIIEQRVAALERAYYEQNNKQN